jgi:hypothetical protein
VCGLPLIKQRPRFLVSFGRAVSFAFADGDPEVRPALHLRKTYRLGQYASSSSAIWRAITPSSSPMPPAR